MLPISAQMVLAVESHQRGDIDKAGAIYSRILAVKPDHPDALHLFGVIEHQRGRYENAVNLIQKAIAGDSENAAFYANLGNAFQECQKPEKAIKCYRKALQLEPNSPQNLFNLGNAFLRNEKLADAVECYEKALCFSPDFFDALLNLGMAWAACGQFEKAVDCCRKAVSLKPESSDAYSNLGMAYTAKGDREEAVVSYRRAIRLSPVEAEPFYNLGNLFHQMGRLQDAASCYREAVKRNKAHIAAHDNLGKTLRDMGRLDEAMSCYQRSLDLNPENIETRFDVATLLLLRGNFHKGLEGYESRFERTNWRSIYPHKLELPRWDGSSLDGKRLFIHSEQGLGDTLQFVRYFPVVKAMGGEIVFETVRPLMMLFKNLKGIDYLLEGPSDKVREMKCDCYLPLLSLPRVLGTRLNTIPSQVPYLFADPEKIAYWQERIPEKRGLRVGLVWAGKKTDARRSCPLELLTPILCLPGVSFVGLQKGIPAGEMSALPQEMAFVNLGEAFEDFSDTAAVIDQLDLIITIDTSVAHLAGAMGKPVWVLLLRTPDWRWLMNCRDSPWYPTMRLFRQTRPGSWAEPVRQMVLELSKRLIDKAVIADTGK